MFFQDVNTYMIFYDNKCLSTICDNCEHSPYHDFCYNDIKKEKEIIILLVVICMLLLNMIEAHLDQTKLKNMLVLHKCKYFRISPTSLNKSCVQKIK